MAAKGKAAFGGMSINFKGREESMEDIFGAVEVSPSDMTKKLWKFVKDKKLMSKEASAASKA